MSCNLCNKSFQQNSLQPFYCNNSITKIYNYIKGKEIDHSNFPISTYPHVPPLRTWGIIEVTGQTGALISRDLVYIDTSGDLISYKYIISISIVNTQNQLYCNSNPVTDCMCIYTDSTDIDGNISYEIPFYVIDSALSKLTFIPSAPPPPTCTPNWTCRTPLDGYEHDTNNCTGSVDRLNSICNPLPPSTEPPPTITPTYNKYIIVGGIGIIIAVGYYLHRQYKMKI